MNSYPSQFTRLPLNTCTQLSLLHTVFLTFDKFRSRMGVPQFILRLFSQWRTTTFSCWKISLVPKYVYTELHAYVHVIDSRWSAFTVNNALCRSDSLVVSRRQSVTSRSRCSLCLFTTPFVWGECPSKVKTTSPVSTLNKSGRCLLFVPAFRPFRFKPRWKRFRKNPKVRIHSFLLDLDESPN